MLFSGGRGGPAWGSRRVGADRAQVNAEVALDGDVSRRVLRRLLQRTWRSRGEEGRSVAPPKMSVWQGTLATSDGWEKGSRAVRRPCSGPGRAARDAKRVQQTGVRTSERLWACEESSAGDDGDVDE